MSDLSVSGQSVITPTFKTEQVASSATSGNSSIPAPAKDFVAHATQQSAISALLSGQSVMVSVSGDNVALAQPSPRIDKMNAEQQRSLVNYSHSFRHTADDHKLDLVAASASTLFTSQIKTMSNVKGNERANLLEENSVKSSGGDIAVRSHSAVENGTDITRAQNAGFINVVGDIMTLQTMNALVTTLNSAEAIAYQQSAMATKLMVSSAERGGQNGIEAAEQRRTGAIGAGLAGFIGHGTSSLFSLKSLRSEKRSIDNNVKPARSLQQELDNDRIAIKAAGSNLRQDGESMSSQVKAGLEAGHAEREFDITEKHDKHTLKQNKTQQTRAVTEFGNQFTHSSQNIIEKSQDVSAAAESKKADLARADQSVNNELSGAHQQTAKKAHDSRVSLEQVLEGALNSNSNAGSTIAGTR